MVKPVMIFPITSGSRVNAAILQTAPLSEFGLAEHDQSLPHATEQGSALGKCEF